MSDQRRKADKERNDDEYACARPQDPNTVLYRAVRLSDRRSDQRDKGAQSEASRLIRDAVRRSRQGAVEPDHRCEYAHHQRDPVLETLARQLDKTA